MKEKIMMYCYTGENWDSTPIGGKGLIDITNMTPEKAATVADLQREFMNRKIHIKRETVK